MIKLYILPAAFGLRNPSPFCMKVEMALGYLNLDFETVIEPNPRNAPKGKLPWLVDGGILPDSELILDYLDEKSNGGLFGDLSPLEMATGTAFTRLAEDHLYWMVVAARWLDDDWFKVVKRDFFGFLPAPAGALFAKLARRQMRQTYNLHGLGRHSLAEQEQFARRDLQAISHQVSAHNYIAGDRLTAHDFAVASLLAGLLDNQPATWISRIGSQFPAVCEYAERVQKETGVYSREMD